ncbi:MAG: Zn-finger containing pyrophosphohydrolase [Clostridiales bacterium]|nr:Zn-finger containing pyrophosphohydrolase [Clostridiales bacterium]
MQNKFNRGMEDYCFIFEGSKLLVKKMNGQTNIPVNGDLENMNINLAHSRYFGDLKGSACYSIDKPTDFTPSVNLFFTDLRELACIFDEKLFHLACRGLHLLRWFENNRHCSKCGTLAEDKQDEVAKICPKCGFINYPRISPAIIVAVINKDKLLLAHNSRFVEKRYSVIAGFVEPGETFEECVVREVKEEVGIEVKSIKYFSSQPWPFPDSVMIGFTAEYAGGEIKEDGIEILDAGWYGADELPMTPSGGSVAGKLIKWFVENYPQNKE